MPKIWGKDESLWLDKEDGEGNKGGATEAKTALAPPGPDLHNPSKRRAVLWCLASVCEGLREPPGGPRSGGEAMSEAKPGRWRPRRGHAQILDNQYFTFIIVYSVS